jgi:hypothetical protein
MGNDADVRAEPLDDLQHVRRQKQRRSARDITRQHVADHARCDGIDSLERLIKKQQVRIRQERGRERELLFHPVGILERQLFLFPLQAQEPEQVVAAAADRSGGDAVHPADERQIFRAGQVIEECQVFGNHADVPLRLQSFFGDRHVPTEDGDLPGAGSQQPGEHLDRRRFARAVGPEKAVRDAALDLEVDAVDRAKLVKEPRQSAGFDSQAHPAFSSPCDLCQSAARFR